MRRIICLTVLVFGFAWSAHASPVYRSTNASGVTVYSSKPKNPGDTPAELPPIEKGEIKLTDSNLQTCKMHGGVNCDAGPDGDGSAVCYDGFRDAVNRYRSACKTPKLEVTNVTTRRPNGSFDVYVRNSGAANAEKPKLSYRPARGIDFQVPGPDTIPPFEEAMFTYVPKDPSESYPQADAGQIDLACANCP